MLNIKPGIGIVKSKGASVSLILDDYEDAQIAYSFRKLNSSYAGNCIKVRRTNDNAEADIGFTEEGLLDVAALKAHCGYNSGFITLWYDQSGNNNNATQATALNQPLIYYKGFVLTKNGLPFALFKAHNATYINGNTNSHGINSNMDLTTPVSLGDDGMAVNVLSRVINTRNIPSLSGDSSASPPYPGGTYSSGTLYMADAKRFKGIATADYNNLQLLTGSYNSTAIFLDRGGWSLNMTSPSASTRTPDTVNEIGRYSTSVGGQGAGRAQEYIFWTKDMSSDKADIQKEITKHYNTKGNTIILPTTGLFGHWKADFGLVRNGTTSNIQEWKDSSANGNNIPQSNATYQPAIQNRYRTTKPGDNTKWDAPTDEAWPASSYDRVYLNNDSFRSTTIAPTFSDNGFTIGVILQSSGGTYNTIAQAWDQTTKYQFGIGTDANTSTLSMSFSNPVSGGSNNRCSINCVDENGDALNLDDRTNFIVASWSASGGFKCRINGVDQTIVLGSYSAASAHVSHFSIGDSKEQWAKWAGWIGELIWYENQLSDDDVKIVEKYFRHKWFASALPTDFSDLVVWTNAMQGVTKDGANKVSQWNDLSGNNNHFVQATGTKQPVWTASEYNGKPALVFDGVDDFMKSAGLITGEGRTFILVMHTTSGHGLNGQSFLSTYHNASTNFHWLQRYSGNWRNVKNTITGGTASAKEHGNVIYFSTPAYATWTFMTPPDSDIAGALLRIGSTSISNGHGHWGGDSRSSGGVNGAVTSTYTFPYTPNGEGIWLMCSANETQFQRFRVAEVIIYNRMLETYEHEAIASYLHRKYKA